MGGFGGVGHAGPQPEVAGRGLPVGADLGAELSRIRHRGPVHAAYQQRQRRPRLLEAVCAYVGVDVVDVIAHSLGCTLMYSVFRGLDRRTAPITWSQPTRGHQVGTFVSLAGAFHGLGAGSAGE